MNTALNIGALVAIMWLAIYFFDTYPGTNGAALGVAVIIVWLTFLIYTIYTVFHDVQLLSGKGRGDNDF